MQNKKERSTVFIVKSCPQLMNSVYADGREAYGECGSSVTDEKCYEVKNCPFRQVAENLLRVVNHQLCGRCDGIGYEGGCLDDECGTYAAYKCLDLLGMEFTDEEDSDLADNLKIC